MENVPSQKSHCQHMKVEDENIALTCNILH